jgi:hypothetical protein
MTEQNKIRNVMNKEMKTLKDLGKKHYENMHYSFDVYYYPEYNDDLHIGVLKNIDKIRGYEVRLSGETIEELVQKADNFLSFCKGITIDYSQMKCFILDWNMQHPSQLKEQVGIFNDFADITNNNELSLKEVSEEYDKVKRVIYQS